MAPLSYSVFTKPWRELSMDELGALASRLGFTGVEFPVRPGYQVEPENVERGLIKLKEVLAGYGVAITSVASGTQEPIFAACSEAGVKVLRIMAPFSLKKGYWKAEADFRSMLDGLVPLCERYGVTVGVQHHCGPGANNAMELFYLLRGYDPKHIGAIWDAAHSALAGEVVEQSLDILYEKLCLVNFKNAFHKRMNGPEAKQARFAPYFTTGRNGNTDWERALRFLKNRGYGGVLCMPAEYTDVAGVEGYIAEDLAYLRSLVDEVYGG